MLAGLGPLLASVVAIDMVEIMQRAKRNAILYGLALVFFLTAYVMALSALALHLGETMGLPISLLVIAGGALVLALIMLSWVAISNSVQASRKKKNAAANSSKALMATAALSAVPMLLKSRPLLLAAGAAGIGYLMLGRSQQIKRDITRD